MMSNLYEPYSVTEEEKGKDECKKIIQHSVDIDVPIDVVPKAEIGRIEAECCGEPKLLCADGVKPDACHFLLVQTVSFRIPVKYSFDYSVGKSMTECCDGCTE